MKKIVSAAFLFICMSTCGACTSNQQLQINQDGSGTAVFHLEIHKLFADFFSEDDGKKVALFDIGKIKQTLGNRPGVTVKKVTASTPESIDVEVAFKNVRTLLSDDDDNNLISLTEKNGQTTFAFHLERKNAKQLSKLFADASSPAFQEMSPRKQRTSSEKEYLEAIQFAVGNDGPSIMKQSYVELKVKPEGDIISQSGGKIDNGQVVFRVSLLKMLLMEKPLDYTVTFSKAHKTAQKPLPKAK
jgi:hypothetical protein